MRFTVDNFFKTLAIRRKHERPTESIQHWEEVGTELENAITAYQSACLALEQSALTGPLADAESLPVSLGRRLELFNKLIKHPADESLASISRGRNKLVLPCHQIHPEVLTRIFEFVVQAEVRSEAASIYKFTKSMWASLYRIIGVCSFWRKIALGHKFLWEFVPLIYYDSSQCLTEMSLDRSLKYAGEANLVLAADITGLHSAHLPSEAKLVANGARFRLLAIKASSLSVMESVLQAALIRAVPGSISELELCLEPHLPDQPQNLGTHTLFHSGAPFVRAHLEEVLGFVQSFRLSNVIFPIIDHLFYSVVQLQIHKVVFKTDATLREFMWTLSTANNLQVLDIVSVTAFEQDLEPPLTHDIYFSLPCLQTLYLEDLSLNVLRTVLRAIQPGSYHIALSITDRSFFAIRPNGEFPMSLASFRNTIVSHAISVLELGESFSQTSRGALQYLLSSMPDIIAISLDKQVLDRESLLALTRPQGIPTFSIFPNLRSLYISRTSIDDVDDTAFKNMVSSHSLIELVLIGDFKFGKAMQMKWTEDESISWIEPYDAMPNAQNSTTLTWLLDEMQNVLLRPYNPPPLAGQFESPMLLQIQLDQYCNFRSIAQRTIYGVPKIVHICPKFLSALLKSGVLFSELSFIMS
ncbi:hypothetical protein RSOLAG1IB_10544 [Rhizoctonia solani AG-1 IB]|uniref:F-box domain-containing protein n=1 Tax=Thanatephorus cucumeris (strain AG1-IB / isolate 7/3/14) TaxID=1108050 RepID=A0A0B7FY37_THACB|nr:hypothetical protein RSOLAG1IB_10544 [Rhizoctonia solani AG-1 IB]